MPNLYSNPEPSDTNVAPPLQQRLSNFLAGLAARIAQPQVSQVRVPTRAEPESPPQIKTQDEPAGRAYPDATYTSAAYNEWREIFAFGTTRQARYKDYALMDTGQVEAMLDAIVDATLISDDGQVVGFDVEAKAKYQNILDQVCRDADLKRGIKFILRDVLRDGDNFVGAVFDEYFNIVDYDNPPADQMYVFADKHMRLLTGTETDIRNGVTFAKAYQQKDAGLSTVAAWHPFEMFHLKWRPSRRWLYSTESYLESMRADWYKLKMIEEALVMHRVTRSSPRNSHFVDVTGMSPEQAQIAVKQYADQITTSKLSTGETVKATVQVDEDYFFGVQYRSAADGKLYPSLNSIQTFDPRNTGLTNLPDVEYFQKKLFSRLPSEFVGVQSDREDISTQDVAASRLFSYCQFILEYQLLRPLFNLALVLKGYTPQEDDYKIIFPSVQLKSSWRWADAQFRSSMAHANEIETGISTRKEIAMREKGWTEQQWNEHETQWKKEKDFYGEVAATNTGTQGGASKSTQTRAIRKGNNSQ